ncbi:MAG: sugar phosphate isomerase/epimerase [Actinomycetales bacterium]|nr:sugar phosphate isomerase/epimerase [Actinomycetales bacterium]
MLGLPTTNAEGVSASEAGPDFWHRQLRGIADEGFTNVELSDAWLKPAALSAPQRQEFLDIASSLGLSVPSMHIQRASVIQPGQREQNLSYQHASIDAAAEMGVSLYSTGLHQPLTPAQKKSLWFWTAQGSLDPDDRETWDSAVMHIRELGKHAADLGMNLALEMYEDTYLGTADSAIRFVETVDLSTVGLNPDVGNLIRLHRPVEDWRELYAKTLPYANYWHLKNYSRDEDNNLGYYVSTPSTLRDGLINYREVIDMAIATGYDGFLTCEHYGGDSISVCGENQRYLRKILATTLSE